MKYLITGGTGSFGSRYVKHLHETTDSEIVVFSRNENAQWKMRDLYDSRVKYLLGDVRDCDAVENAMEDVDIVIHAAALKHVRTGEVQPWEAIQTNVIGTKIVAEACIRHGAKMVLISTDKAVRPTNLYGASKMTAEKITLNAGFAVTRWGNVFGSAGSILHIFKEQAARGHLFTITDRRMTRFIITFQECFKVVDEAVNIGHGLVLPDKIYGINIVDLAHAFDDEARFDEVGIQHGEKLSEWLSDSPVISSEDCEKLTVEEIRSLINESV